MKIKTIVLMVVVCTVVTTIGCIDKLETEKIPTSIPTIVPTHIPTETVVSSMEMDKEEFIDKYTKAKKIFNYGSYEPELKANESENLADSYYERDEFSKAGDKYGEAAQFYLEAREQNIEAKALFEELYKIAPTEHYKGLCRLYVDTTQSYAKLMDYMSSATEHMEKACDYYEKGNYKAGNEEVDKAEKEIIQYNIEVVMIYNVAIEKIDEIEYR